MTGPVPVVRRQVGGAYHRWHTAPIRTRLTAAAAGAATLALVCVVAVSYIAVRHELRSNIDSQLRQQAGEVYLQSSGPFSYQTELHSQVGDVGGYIQVVNSAGAVISTPPNPKQPKIPIDSADRNVAAHGGSVIRDAQVGDLHCRVLTEQLSQVPNGAAVQIALPLSRVDHQLHKVGLAFLLLALAGLGLVAGGTWLAVRRVMRPVATLTVAAEQIAVTRDLTTRISTYGEDELGRLAMSFNTMLDALERSLGQQRQLILDASHELRTPLASLRTNVEVLHDVDRLSVEQRRSLLDGIVTQLDELTVLVADVVELARGEAPPSAQEEVALDDLVSNSVDRARRHWPQIVYLLHADPVSVRGVPSRLDRAVMNLLDNAGKFSAPGSVVDVALSQSGELSVADRGPGIPDSSLPHVFDRFYRADEARAMPGSGLGLAIVKQVIEGHGGTVAIRNRDHGGTLVTVTLPVVRQDEGVNPPAPAAEPQPVGR